jgi:3-dehydroquinate synthase
VIRVDVELPGHAAYPVVIGAGALGELRAHAGERPFGIVDERVFELHGALVAPLFALAAVPAGEAAKDWATLELALGAMAQQGLDRGSIALAFGGGATLDVGGLAASLYMRGVRVVYGPTTLLAMVDASVGGKTAINIAQGKNLVGTFHQPSAVLADTRTLATLPDAEWRSGLGEVLKAALVEGEELLALVERNAAALAARELAAVEPVIAACVRSKASIVASDERESGPRKALNLGHTFAHALEKVAGFGAIPHGVAVACGLALALEASERAGLLQDRGLRARVDTLLRALQLPRSLGELRMRHGALPAAELLAAMRHDKKASAGRPAFVLPRAAGSLELAVALDDAAVLALLA